MTDSIVKPSDDFDYYTGNIYWNNFEDIVELHNKQISGHVHKDWQIHIKEKYGTKEKAFVFSIGNGWVERDLFSKEVISNVVGFDIMEKYVEEARMHASEINMPADYFVADGNTYEPGDLKCDIAVNVGAMHHISKINRMTRLLSGIVSDGIYVGFDYVGHHRNQYSWDVWSNLLSVNNFLPEKYRVPLRYPHMNTMLAMDPSEAVHSELQDECLRRYFDIVEYQPLGGAVAYNLLYNNHRLYAERNTEEGKAVLSYIIDKDMHWKNADKECNLFSFFVAKPKVDMPPDDVLDDWQRQEDERERAASENKGRYYPPTPLELIYNDLADAEYQLRILKGDV